MLFGRHYNREGAVLRGRGTLQECRRITERALSCKVRDTEGFEEIVAEPSTPRMATGWDIVWCDGRKTGADATDDPELCDVAARLHDAATRPDRPRGEDVRGGAGEASRSEARPSVARGAEAPACSSAATGRPASPGNHRIPVGSAPCVTPRRAGPLIQRRRERRKRRKAKPVSRVPEPDVQGRMSGSSWNFKTAIL